MADIKDSVGEGGTNRGHDVAMVQAMLRVVKNAKGHVYLHGIYDGSYGNQTKNAIIDFQKDYNLAPVPAPGKAAPPPGPGQEKFGLINAGGVTVQKLNAMLPPSHKDILVVEGTKTVYWPGSAADAANHEKNISNDADLEPSFRAIVAKLVNLMFARHKIVLSLTNTGGRRTFQKQFDLVTQPDPPTQAGPGESNHNFGQAVDIGFKGFKWMRGDGSSVGPNRDTWWLNELAHFPAKSAEMWAVRNKIAADELGLFRSNLKGDLIHIQKFSDDNVSMRNSLADLLTRVGTMKWSHGGVYKCDLGGGGKHYPVGTSVQIWAGNSPVTKADVAAAAGVPLAKVKDTDVKAMQQKLKAEFEAAEVKWVKWEAKP